MTHERQLGKGHTGTEGAIFTVSVGLKLVQN